MMKRLKILTYPVVWFLGIVLITLVGCRPLVPTQHAPLKLFQLDRVKCVELSENRGAMASKDDEIVVLQSVFEVRNSVSKVNHQIDTCLFTANGQVYELNFERVMTNDTLELVSFYSLIESDEDNSRELLEGGFMTIDTLTTHNYKNVLTAFLLDKLNSDDVLGIKRVDGIAPDSLIFKGKHLFDDFEYRLIFRLD